MSRSRFLSRGISRRQLLASLLGVAGSAALINHFAFGNGTAAAAIEGPPESTVGQGRRILITGSTAGIGFMTAELLLAQGHRVVLHGRSQQSMQAARTRLPGAEGGLVADFGSLSQLRAMALEANASGAFDVIIHNAAVGYQEPQRLLTEDDLPHVFAINTLAPYVLTALLLPPKRQQYLSSQAHRNARANTSLDDLLWTRRAWSGQQAYNESKLHDTMLAFAMARRWPQVLTTAVNPGWVPTALGGAGASDDLSQSHLTQVWLASSDEPEAMVSGAYFYHMAAGVLNPDVRDVPAQERLLAACERISGVAMPTLPV
ncbi:MAG: SDR family NAD(P)-dependent oxidoreductase [Neisseriaceae bacterium]|nr:SDR family NAD(P)-dependent oxidoreductase [Neisseriaceae bacterium]